ncbi:Acetyltransferase (GNAT) domain-containing protein [Nonomuraea maritima]|uniref:Acetyltransferase (GNAT) domain-containing protein n=1 Tax=Nonomuraea maritima TaxID=683260 RepID=A0A1G9JMJ7_9ACTN|nr:GNAT family N-acetyltransferase [Nonomuraea maritima]SDL38526.1 Acetyltransferase (GNAT) domain-containing protein [Nonomuraea maritima]
MTENDVPRTAENGVPAVRAAAESDMPAVRAVAERFGLLKGWPATPDFLDAERLFGTLLLAPSADGRAHGFGGTLRRGSVTHLGDLFVLRERQSSGVGRALLAELLAGDGPKVTFASSDPRAMGLYLRHGLRAWCPLLYLHGPATTPPTWPSTAPPGVHRAGPPAATPGSPVREVRPEDVADLDARAAGGARPDTLAWYARTSGVTPYTTGRGYAFARPIGSEILIGPAGGDTPQDCADAVLGTLAAASETTGAATARIALPGVNPLVLPLMQAGWRIGDHDTFMADDRALSLIHPDRYAPHPDLG